MNISRILCPTDFSETSAHAAEWAAAIAGYYGASITALHVVQPPMDATLGVESLDSLRQQTAGFFGVATNVGLSVDARVEVGSPVRHILDRAASLPADLLVMGTHGASGFEHLVLGSVTEKVLRKARCPVLTVPPRVGARSRLPFRRLLCAVDFSAASASAVHFALSLAAESDACLTLLHVLEWPWHEPPQPSTDALPPEQAFALAMFRRESEECAGKQLESMIPPTQSRVHAAVVSGTPHEQVLAAAAAESVDLIVLGVGRRSALNLAFLGSTTNHVVRAATCPVMTLRDREIEAQRDTQKDER
jgi:nucleotide-binding universal stress UspA family protein